MNNETFNKLDTVNKKMLSLKEKTSEELIQYEINKIRLEHSIYIESKNNFWKDKFKYSPTESSSFPKVNIYDFFKETDINKSIDKINSFIDWYNFLSDTSKSFMVWAATKKASGLTELDLEKMPNFVKGMLGEYFSISLLNNCKRLIIDSKFYDFDCVTPFMGDDFGIDAVCLYDNGLGKIKPLVCQIKTWNPNSDYKINYTIANSCWSEGIRNNYISDNGCSDKKALIFWLGNKDHITVPLKKYKDLYDQFIFIDSDTFSEQLSSNRLIFWKKIQDDLRDIKNIR